MAGSARWRELRTLSTLDVEDRTDRIPVRIGLVPVSAFGS
jgi:hypothetical protein